jgi:tetratricopeptide (TPR) repeat protein
MAFATLIFHTTMTTRNCLRGFATLWLLLIPFTLSAAELVMGGPNDYYDPNPAIRKILRSVNRAHVEPAVHALSQGKIRYASAHKTGDVFDDLDYALRWFPNHPKALYHMASFFEKYKDSGSAIIPPQASADEYFAKALNFRPRDGNAHALYAVHLHKMGNLDAAQSEYQQAIKLLPNSSELQYNLGLLYADKKDYKNALIYAKKAYAMGYPLPGLRDRLKRAGVWQDDIKVKQKTP